jgi:hypothetical protein
MRSPATLCIVLCFGTLAIAQDHHHEHTGSVKELGRVSFPTSCSKEVQPSFNEGVAMLHSFWYEKAAAAFADISKKDPKCAMAHWGSAMAQYHQLWEPPVGDAYRLGLHHIEEAKRLSAAATQRERDYINALQALYSTGEKGTLRDRALPYSRAMEALHEKYPADNEAAVFYALSLISISPPSDKSYENQKKSGAILNEVLAKEPSHPGVAHYLIHSFDYPTLANIALPAAREYAKIAPAVPHALHMPSHIFTRLGLWQEAIASNAAAEKAAKDFAQSTHMNGAWDQQLHAMDYLVYAYLQSGQEANARAVVDELATIKKVEPEDLTGAYAFAATPARYAVERGDWASAAGLTVRPSRYPAVDAITYVARSIGAARIGNINAAMSDLQRLSDIHNRLIASKDEYWGTQVEIQRREAKSWIQFAEGDKEQALETARSAAELESTTDKLNVSPGSILPARELLGQMLLELHQPDAAIAEFSGALAVAPNRAGSIAGIKKAEAMKMSARKDGAK